jgi:hypothetical protein
MKPDNLMPEKTQATAENLTDITGEMQDIIASRVRKDSKSMALSDPDSLNKLLYKLYEGEVPAIDFADMQKNEQYQDIKTVVSPDGNIYLYSNKYILDSQAETLAMPEDIKPLIAERVRQNSRNSARLTGCKSIFATGTILETDIETALSEMENDDSYGDIKRLCTAGGSTFLYSEKYITGNYAGILARAEANDPCATIAETVREESKLYPRPTSVDYFRQSIFKIDSNELNAHVAYMLTQTQFGDIKTINASTGAQYLYCDRYLTTDHARALVEWEEVGKFANP